MNPSIYACANPSLILGTLDTALDKFSVWGRIDRPMDHIIPNGPMFVVLSAQWQWIYVDITLAAHHA